MIAAILLLLVQDLPVSNAPEAKAVFEARQNDLVELSARLGGLHRLNQLCPGYGRVSVFRDRMQEIIDGERPPRETRDAMVENFNGGFRRMANRHLTCSFDAEQDFQVEAMSALSITERLAAPLFGSRNP